MDQTQPTSQQPAVSAPAPTPQTGVAGKPIVVENVQYKAANSRIGLAFLIYALSLLVGVWLLTHVVALLTSLGLGTATFDNVTKLMLIGYASIGVPFVIAFWLSQLRVHALLKENPANMEDVSFKRTLRTVFFITVLLFAWQVGWTIFSVLSLSLISGAKDLISSATSGQVTLPVVLINQSVSVIAWGGLLWVLWGYQKQTKR